MKQTFKYVFEQIWHLIILLMIAIIFAVLDVEQDFAGGFFPAYLRFSVYVIVAGILFGFLGNLLPRHFHPEKFPFKPYRWEKEGKFYQQKLHINQWKDVVFDISKAEVGIEKKKLESVLPSSGIERLIQETCVAEITHAVLIMISPVMLSFLPTLWAIFFLFAYCVMNLMDVMIQRYNRPRLIKLHCKMLKKENRKK